MKKFFKGIGEKFRNPLKQGNFIPVVDRDSRYIGLKDYARMYIRAIDRYNAYDCGSPDIETKKQELCDDDIKKINKYNSDKQKSRHYLSNSCLKNKISTSRI